MMGKMLLLYAMNFQDAVFRGFIMGALVILFLTIVFIVLLLLIQREVPACKGGGIYERWD